jgi:hypothetical protein
MCEVDAEGTIILLELFQLRSDSYFSMKAFSRSCTKWCTANISTNDLDSDTPQIALPASAETQIETQSKLYTAAAFFHFKATGSLERHRAYHAAYDSDAYIVDFDSDYESGDLTITVDRADES